MPAPVLAPAPARPAPARPDDAPPIGTVRPRTRLVSRLITVVAVVVPPLGLLAAMTGLWGRGFGPVDLALLAVLYVLGGVGITVGFHRLFTHRSFQAPAAVRAVLAVLGSITLQGPVTQWVTDHRRHHAFSDREGDPHSPHTAAPGRARALRGFWHSHVGWMFVTKGMERGEVYGRDLYADPLVRRIDRLYLVWVVISLALPAGLAWLVGGTGAAAVEGLVWGGLVRIFLFHHATFSVNSVCHLFGRRPYEARDRSANNWLVAAFTFGEGWHNNHHAFPRSARLGLSPAQLDPGWWVIRALRACGLAAEVRVPVRPGSSRATA